MRCTIIGSKCRITLIRQLSLLRSHHKEVLLWLKNITIDGIEVPFKASAAVPRLYRLKFRRDIYKDFASLKTEVTEGDENKSEIGIESLEVFENIAYIMAKHADSNVPDNPDDFLEQFNTFSIYEILPQLIELWGLNTATQVESKKNIARLTAR